MRAAAVYVVYRVYAATKQAYGENVGAGTADNPIEPVCKRPGPVYR